jgi:hypothetical protein
MIKERIVCFILICFLHLSAVAQADLPEVFSRNDRQGSALVVLITDFGAVPGSGADATEAVKAAIEKIATLNGAPAVLRFPEGRYDFWAENAPRMHLPVTAVHQQWDFIAGLYLRGLKNVTIDGCGSELLFHSRMTPVVIDQCENITIRNISIDHSRPTVSELLVRRVGENFMDAEIHPDSWYVIDKGKFFWKGADGDLYAPELFQQYDPAGDETWRDNINLGHRAEETGPRMVRFHYSQIPNTLAGRIWQMRGDGIRNQQGAVVNLSKNITWEDVNMYFCTGLGIVSQLSENLVFHRVNIEPRKGSGRTCASFADGIHCCNCTGHVIIKDCRIVGMQDDPVNIYGNDLNVTALEAPDRLILSYSTWEQCGYLMFFPGDELVLLRKETLLPFSTRKIVSAELIDKMTHRVVLDGPVPDDCIGHVAENRTRMPEITISDSYFSRTPTRGVLVSSWRKSVIENCTFHRTRMAAIFVCHGDDPYFLQGAVEDLTIRNNVFNECRGGVFIQPDQPVVDRNAPVDKNITVTGNRFVVGDIERPVLWARSTQDILFTKNRIEVSKPGLPLVWLHGCSGVVIRKNRIRGDRQGIVEVLDYDDGLTTKGLIEADRRWSIVPGILRPGSK